MSAFREFLAIVRCAQTALAVRWCQWDLDRARVRLAKALDAHDHAVADYRAHFPGVVPEPIPQYLRRAK